GRSSAKKFGFLQIVKEELEKNGIEPVFFEEVEPNPSMDTVSKGAHLFKEKKCEFIVTMGGGSPLDAAKAIGILATNPAPLSSYVGKGKVKTPPPPLIAIPTTSGTGSEVTPYAVITDTRDDVKNQKKVISDHHIFPKEAILDPELTLPMPEELTCDTAVDVLSHAVESYISKRAFPLTENICLQAIALIGENLPRVLENPGDIEARENLMYSATLAGIAIAQTGATILHSMGYPLTSSFGISHGKANGILLPWFWEISFEGNPGKFSTILKTLLKKVDQRKAEDAKESARLIKKFLHDSKIPEKIEIKVNDATLRDFASFIAENKEKNAAGPKFLQFEEILNIYRK
ncbi:iron-containing alcohol dehydrogenase, partial [Candidatus Aerophobetes bacterium]|nr:iron-containing alcohol dehydrogenase [Candidatus Aerophobetes bacterium]